MSGTNVRDWVHAQTGLDAVNVDRDRDLLRKLVENIGRGQVDPMPRRAFVGARLGHGSGVSDAICRALDLDPDEIVGGDGVCPSCDLPDDETPPEES